LEVTNKETVVRKFDGIAIGIRKTALGKRHGGSVSKVKKKTRWGCGYNTMDRSDVLR